MGGRRLGGPQPSRRVPPVRAHAGVAATLSTSRLAPLLVQSPALMPPAARSKERVRPNSRSTRSGAGPGRCSPWSGPGRPAGPAQSSLSVLASGPPRGPADNEHWRTRDVGRRVARRRRLRGAATNPTPRRTPRRWTLFPTCWPGAPERGPRGELTACRSPEECGSVPTSAALLMSMGTSDLVSLDCTANCSQAASASAPGCLPSSSTPVTAWMRASASSLRRKRESSSIRQPRSESAR